MISYVDTSALIKLIVDEPGSDVAAAVWDQSDRVCAARIGYAEARSALAAAHRSGRLTTPAHRTAKASVDLLWQQVTVVEISQELVVRASELAEEHGLRGYDAVHLAAALTAGADVLASSDHALCRAAQASGLHVPGTES